MIPIRKYLDYLVAPLMAHNKPPHYQRTTYRTRLNKHCLLMASETFSLQQLTVHNTENLTELHWDEKHYVCTMNVPKKSRN